jgi:hypothetical protein
MNAVGGPHASIAVNSSRERFATQLFDALWQRYRSRVAYVQTYEQVIHAAKATLVNDHIAFRTLATEQPLTGIASIARIFEALGYRAAGNYHFADKHLTAIHYQHANRDFPKLFISELKVWELDAPARAAIVRSTRSHRLPLALDTLATLSQLDRDDSSAAELLGEVVAQFHALPWLLPRKEDVALVNGASQYAAWVLVHGYNVNHFTSLINAHGVPALDEIEKTIAALQAAGVPMKAEIEGERGSKLRQTATEAVQIDVDVLDDGRPLKLPWSYAYFELAQRDTVLDPATGEQIRFEGFLGPQATNLFEMTRVKG